MPHLKRTCSAALGLGHLDLASWLLASCLWVLAFGSSAEGHPGDGLIVTKDGSIYFGSVHPMVGGNHFGGVWRLNAEGVVDCVFRSKREPSNVYLAHGRDDRVYVSERYYLGEGGGIDNYQTELWRLGHEDDPPVRLLGPLPGRAPIGEAAFLVDRDGSLIHKQQHRIVRRTLSGDVQHLAGGGRASVDGGPHEARFDAIQKLAWGPGGDIYVLESDAVRIVTEKGEVRTLGSGFASMGERSDILRGGSIVFDIAVDSGGNAFIANWGKRLVLRVGADGKAKVIGRSESPWSPEGVAAKEGEIFLFESQAFEGDLAPRIRKRERDGSVRLLFPRPGSESPEEGEENEDN